MTIVLSEQQGKAVDVIARPDLWKRPFATLAGFAGSGKTSIAPKIIEVMGAKRPMFCAPTNKAAKVLTSKGLPAISLHKAIYLPPGEKEPQEVRDLKERIKTDDDPALKERLAVLLDALDDELTWRINPEGPAACADLILVDEASMVGSELGADLMSFGKPVIAIGDPGQLPPVKDVPFFPLHDPDFLLTEIHRQARDNPIIRLSKDIREGVKLRPGTMGDAVRIAWRGEITMPKNPALMPQIIVGTHKTRWNVTANVRKMLGHQGTLPCPGEPLVVRKNSQSNPELINGVEARCLKMEQAIHDDAVLFGAVDVEGDEVGGLFWNGPFVEHETRKAIKARFGDEDWRQKMQNEVVDFGHAITCHVSQGSQWDHVLVYDESEVFKNDRKRWLYTAVTRAAKKLTIII